MVFQVPQKLLDGILRQFDPVEVYLFGSHARGDAHEDSDIDLYVVLDDDRAKNLDRGRAIGEARRGYPGAVDIVLSTASRYQARKDLIGTLAEIVQGEGKRIYARDV